MRTHAQWLDSIGQALLDVEAGEAPAERLANLAAEISAESESLRDTNAFLTGNIHRLQETNRRLQRRCV